MLDGVGVGSAIHRRVLKELKLRHMKGIDGNYGMNSHVICPKA